MTTPWERFKQAARLGKPEQVPVAFIVDSPWLPSYAGINTLDFFLLPDIWFEIHRGLLDRFPDAVWIPGFWVEYGMVAEPSAFGTRIHFHADRPPSLEPVVTDISHWATVSPANPQEDGFMPLVLRLYEHAEARLRAEGLGIKMVAARGPMVTAGWLMGIGDLVYHNDTPCRHLHTALAEANFDVFNFSNLVDIAEVKAEIGHRVALMGNVPPLDVAVREPPQVVRQWARDCLDKAASGGGMILSVGGGVSPDTPPENLDAMLEAAHTWSRGRVR